MVARSLMALLTLRGMTAAILRLGVVWSSLSIIDSEPFGFAGRSDLGLQDQITALTYVQRHIADFGGDPTNVSLFGESAGGCSVLALFAAPAAKSLFVRGWAMSPSIGQLRTTDRADQSVQLLLDDLGRGFAG